MPSLSCTRMQPMHLWWSPEKLGLLAQSNASNIALSRTSIFLSHGLVRQPFCPFLVARVSVAEQNACPTTPWDTANHLVSSTTLSQAKPQSHTCLRLQSDGSLVLHSDGLRSDYAVRRLSCRNRRRGLLFKRSCISCASSVSPQCIDLVYGRRITRGAVSQ